MNLENIFKPVNRKQLQTLTRQELIEFALGEQSLRTQLEAKVKSLEDEKMKIGDKFVTIKNKLFGRKSEKSPTLSKKKSRSRPPQDKKKILPSERYPNARVLEQNVILDNPGLCSCCGEQLEDSGLTESTEALAVIPKEYVIKRQIYHKYRCKSCHGDIQRSPTIPKIKSGSSYDDSLVIDAALSKYCDLIPMERYCSIAKRQGLEGLPPHSLIDQTHYLAQFLVNVYELIKTEVMNASVLYADETPHRMLEGDKKSNWYLWGFSTLRSSYFECHDTRSGDVVFEVLKESQCKFLISDEYSGYGKAIRRTNEHRKEQGIAKVIEVNCNAHARRKFNDALVNYEESDYFLKCYRKIYRLEKLKKEKSWVFNKIRKWQGLYFNLMRRRCENMAEEHSSSSSFNKALSYFLRNYEKLTLFLKYDEVPIDNNHQERQLRSPVIGRKTWYGTHSKKGAETGTIMFSIIESCKLNDVNPREFFERVVKELHQDRKPFTPAEYVAKMTEFA